jgi:hypothetical protein
VKEEQDDVMYMEELLHRGLSSGLIVSIKPKAGADMAVKSRNGARWSRLSGSRK